VLFYPLLASVLRVWVDRIDHSSSRLVVELEEFHETIKGVLEVLEGQAKRIEREKLKVLPTLRLVLSGDGLIL